MNSPIQASHRKHSRQEKHLVNRVGNTAWMRRDIRLNTYLILYSMNLLLNNPLDQQQQHHQEQEEQQQPNVEESHEDRSDDLISDTPHSTGDGVLSVDVDEQAQGSVSNEKEKEEVAGEHVQTELLPTKTIAWPEEENPSATRPEDNEKGEVFSEIVFVS